MILIFRTVHENFVQKLKIVVKNSEKLNCSNYFILILYYVIIKWINLRFQYLKKFWHVLKIDTMLSLFFHLHNVCFLTSYKADKHLFKDVFADAQRKLLTVCIVQENGLTRYLSK